MATPSPKSNFIQTLLIVTLIFFGVQLLFPPKPSDYAYYGKKVSTLAEFQTALQDANKNLYDVSAKELEGFINRALDKEVAEKRLTQAEADRQRRETVIRVADTQFKAGIARQDTGRIRNAYHTILGWHNRMQTKPEWKEPVAVADKTADERFGWKEQSGNGLYNAIVERISLRAKTDKIWGAIPGGYAFIDWLVHLTGAVPGFSYAFAAFLLALVVRAAVWPLAQKQLMFGRQMMALSPMINEIREQYKDEPAVMQKKTMEVYQQYGINPMAGCFPALVQIPLFLTVYQCMLLYEFEFQKGTFLWVNPNTAAALPQGLVAPNLGQLDPLLILIYGIMMVVSTLLTPVSDPAQIKQQRIMGIGISLFFTVTMFFGWFPVPGAFVLYWIFLLVLSTLQSLRAYRLPLPPLEKVNTAAGGVYPSGFAGKWAKRMEEMMQTSAGAAGESGSNGKSNGAKPSGGVGDTGKTGTPAKHKPKKRR